MSELKFSLISHILKDAFQALINLKLIYDPLLSRGMKQHDPPIYRRLSPKLSIVTFDVTVSLIKGFRAMRKQIMCNTVIN